MRSAQISKIKILNLVIASLLGSVFSCTQKKEPKKIPHYEVYVPLLEDYPKLKEGLSSLLSLSAPQSQVTFHEGLSDNYQLAPFDDWMTKADLEGLLRLKIKTEKADDLEAIIAFLSKKETLIPFKVSLPRASQAASYTRGETLFCRQKLEAKDLYERQLCQELFNAVCGTRQAARRSLNFPDVACSLELVKPEESTASKARPKEFFLSGFPLPIKVKNDYPFLRYGEVDELLLLELF